MTRFTSRAWKRNAIRPFGSFSTPAWRATVHVPASAHWLRRNGGSEYACGWSNAASGSEAKPLLWP